MKTKYIKSIVLLGLIASITLSSCQVTNKYKSPKVDSENLFRDKDSIDTTTIAHIPWKEYFTDPLLQAYIHEGLSNNYDMQIVAERIKQAEAILGMARAAYFPDVALAAQVNQTRLSNADPLTGMPQKRNSLAYHKETYSLGVVTSWELDIWGKMNRQSRAKYADMLNSYAGRNLIQSSLVSNIANTYYALLSMDEQLKVTNEMIVLMEKNLVTTEALKESGMTTGAAVEQTRAALHRLKTSVLDLENNSKQLENAMCSMLGRKSGAIFRTNLANQKIETSLAYGVPAQMLSRRPDVQQAEMTFRSAFELTNVARTSFYPSITLTSGMIGFSTTNGLSNFFKPENLFASLAGGLTQPLFARKQLITQLKVAKAEEKASLLTFEKTVLAAGQEVSNIMCTYDSSVKKNESRSIQVESQMKAVDYSQDLLIAGEATYLEVLSAQLGLLEAQLGQISDKLQQLQAMSDLYRALGGGVE